MPRYKRARKKDTISPPLVNVNDLVPEEVAPEGVAEKETPEPKRLQLRLKILYVLLGFFSGILFAGSILLIVYSC